MHTPQEAADQSVPVAVPQPRQLDVARRIEATAGLVRSLRGQVKHGPHKDTRRRVRKQLGKLTDMLDEVQRFALANGMTRAAADDLIAVLAGLEPALEAVLYHPWQKAQLTGLADHLKETRHTLRDRLVVLRDEAD